MRPIFSTCSLTVGSEFFSIIIVGGGKWIVQIGEIKRIDWLKNRFEVQYRYLNGNFGGLAWTSFNDVPITANGMRISDWRGMREQNYFESVTTFQALAGDNDGSVTDGECVICGKPKSPRAKTCSAKCRKKLSRMS